jgi:capsular polysaccharide biosynthesis protein
MSFREQVSMFASARVIAGAIGSGLTNIVFSRPGTKLIELVHRHYENHVFRALADGAGCSYERMCFT